MEVSGKNLSEIYRHTLEEIEKYGDTVSPRGQTTTEVIGGMIITTDPWTGRFISMKDRVLNYAFGLLEGFQIIAGVTSLEALAYYNPRMRRFSNQGMLHGAYGPRLRRSTGTDLNGADWQLRGCMDQQKTLDQLQNVILKLRVDPWSRQAIASIWDPSKDCIYKVGDLPCNTQVMFNIRSAEPNSIIYDRRLNITVVRRSSDAIWGWPYDYLHFSMLQDVIANSLELKTGPMTEFSNSLHYYDHLYTDGELEASKAYNWQDHPLDYCGQIKSTLDEFDIFWKAFEESEKIMRTGESALEVKFKSGMDWIKKSTKDHWLIGAAWVILGFSLLTDENPTQGSDQIVKLLTSYKVQKAWHSILLQSVQKRWQLTKRDSLFTDSIREALKC